MPPVRVWTASGPNSGPLVLWPRQAPLLLHVVWFLNLGLENVPSHSNWHVNGRYCAAAALQAFYPISIIHFEHLRAAFGKNEFSWLLPGICNHLENIPAFFCFWSGVESGCRCIPLRRSSFSWRVEFERPRTFLQSCHAGCLLASGRLY